MKDKEKQNIIHAGATDSDTVELDRYYEDVFDKANEAIATNEDVIDRQSFVVCIGLLGVIVKLSYDVGNFGVLEYSILCISCIILIISFFIPMNFVSRNRRMIYKLEDAAKNGDIKTKDDITAIRKKCIKDEKITLDVSLCEFVRFTLLLIDIVLIALYFLIM